MLCVSMVDQIRIKHLTLCLRLGSTKYAWVEGVLSLGILVSLLAYLNSKSSVFDDDCC